MGPVVMALCLLVAFGVFAWSAHHRWRLMRVAASAGPFGQVRRRIAATLRFAFAQQRMTRYRGAGIAHILIFSGFLVLLARSLMLWGRGFDEHFNLWILGTDQPLGRVYALCKDVFALAVIAGTLAFFYYRLVKRLPRMTQSTEALLILGIILTMMVADILYDGADRVAAARDAGTARAALSYWEPAGSGTALLLEALDPSDTTITVLRHAGFWTHALLVLIFLNILPYSKHFHIITAIPNVYLQNLDPPGRLRPIEDLEARVERGQTLGVARIDQFSWKGVLDLYTCTECGRCTDFCPAANTGKLLSPKQFTVDLRDHLYARKGEFLHPAADGPQPIDLTDGVIDPQVLWACTTCRACEQECPVFISYVDKFVDMRRYLVQEKGEMPAPLATAFRGMENSGNPWNLPSSQRGEWMQGLDIARVADKPDADWLLWVGCAPAYDEKARRIARATAQLLTRAGVDFAVLGGDEQCTGDPARRAGNEFLYQVLAQANIEALNGLGIKKIITVCPHCYNTLAREYPDFGGAYEVVHHTDLLAQLVLDGTLKPQRPVNAKIVYHDACYLGRYNNIYDAPRRVLSSIPGVQIVEAAQNRDRGMCCGAGGAQFFKEEEPGGDRVNYARTDQLLTTGADVVASACPFCMRMLTDGLAACDRADVRQMDIAEVLWQSVQPNADESSSAARSS